MFANRCLLADSSPHEGGSPFYYNVFRAGAFKAPRVFLPIDLYVSIKWNNGVFLLHLPRRLAAGSYRFEHVAPVCGVLGFVLLPSDIADLRHKPRLCNVRN